MNRKEAERYAHLLKNLARLGISYEHQMQLIRIERTLSRWSERECNGEVEVDEETGHAYAMSNPERDKYRRLYRTANREQGAKRRLFKIMANYPHLVAYHQGDPRGCSLYICERATTPQPIDSYYTRGLAVCY